jgi:hypothetical protein
LGILCFAVWTLGCIYACVNLCLPDNLRHVFSPRDSLWLQTLIGIGVTGCAVGIGLFWATIFGHDQKNDSYRCLSRLGIHEGKVWWSRILPAAILYVFVIFGVVAFQFMETFFNDRELIDHYRDFALPILVEHRERIWGNFWKLIPVCFTIWFAPMAVGAFISISFRSQLVGIALTGGGLFVLAAWVQLGYTLFGCSPWWTTLPICIALLIASRIRAWYWLRERFTWRSRIIPLIPVFVTTAAVLIALPPVRIYSVPYVSWEQIDAYFDKADMQGRIRAPEKRKALLRYIAEHKAVPPDYEQVYTEITKRHWQLEDIGHCTFEEIVLLDYVSRWNLLTQPIESIANGKTTITNLTRYTPWESERIDRVLRLQIVASLVTHGGLQDPHAKAIEAFCHTPYRRNSYFDQWVWWGYSLARETEDALRRNRMSKVFDALDRWYDEHDQTLPESLDELVGTYLDAIPAHPFTNEALEYHRNVPPSDEGYRIVGNSSVHYIGQSANKQQHWERDRKANTAFRQSGGTYLRWGRWVYLIIEPAEGE